MPYYKYRGTRNDDEERKSSRPLLTPYRIKILCLMANGRTNEQIARELFISLDSVKTNIARIKQRLNTLDRANTVAVAMWWGYIPLNALKIPEPSPPQVTGPKRKKVTDGDDLRTMDT